MSAFYWYLPLDPSCPEVEKFDHSMENDPMVAYSGCGDEIAEDFHKRHLAKCKRCQEYGAANIEVMGP